VARPEESWKSKKATEGIREVWNARRARHAMKPGMLQLQPTDGRGTASFMTNYTGSGPYQDRRERLIFHTYGNHFFLSQVWIDDVNPGHELSVSAAELEYARTAHQTQTVLVAEGQPHK